MNQFQTRLKLIHLIGVGGSGMSGIAEVLLNLGYKVSGSDLKGTDITRRLDSIGLKLYIGHDVENINHADLVVISSAIDENNKELLEARNRNIPIMKRAEMLAGLMNLKHGIAVAGTHGKTTTTSFLASIFSEAELDPTFIIGGRLNHYDSNAKLGQGKYLIVEADESDQSFLELQPSSSLITNIEEDHLINYENKFQNLKNAFVRFVKKLPFDGFLVACGDDLNVRELKPLFARPTITYGFSEDNDYVIKEIEHENHLSYFSIYKDGHLILSSGLNLLGSHNVLNAVGASVMALEERIDTKSIRKALENFQGVTRRMELKGDLNIKGQVVSLIDDYGHHPSEINEIIKTLKKRWPFKKIIMIFQPHRYTRTRDMFEDFSRVLAKVDILLLMNIYPAGEPEIQKITSEALASHILKQQSNITTLISSAEEAERELLSLDLENSILIVQGAGDIGILSETLINKYG